MGRAPWCDEGTGICLGLECAQHSPPPLVTLKTEVAGRGL